MVGLLLAATAFAFFIICPRMAGMGAVISRIHGLNPYLVALIGGVLEIPLIILMEYLVVNYGVHTAIIVAAATDILVALVTGILKPRYMIEVFIIALFLWIGVILASKLTPIIAEIPKLETASKIKAKIA